MAISNANWIMASDTIGDVCPIFSRGWKSEKAIKKAEMNVSALGVYEATINNQRVSDDVLAPAWTSYEHRIQFQTYDITNLLGDDNEFRILAGKGWFSSPMPGWLETDNKKLRASHPIGIIAEIVICYEDGTSESIVSDENWAWAESKVLFSEIYDGEIYDASKKIVNWQPAKVLDWSKDVLIPQEGQPIIEQERVYPKKFIKTQKGEAVIDFGQVITGYVEIEIEAKEGDKISILHGEVLDADGNFYNDNYRSAKAKLEYTCSEGWQRWKPKLTFFGFRYIKIAKAPAYVSERNFTGIMVQSKLKKTGSISCSNAKVNRLFSNIIWGQKDNFLDVPTDCPQRDERLGWTGDAQAFVKAASYNFDVENFFKKWLRDLALEQYDDGGVPQVIPDYLPETEPSAAWGDAATIIPWQMYQTYGNKEALGEQFASMQRWVDYITNSTTTPGLWSGGTHFGDWLGLDAPVGSYTGATRKDFIATAFYAYSTELLIKAGKVLNKDMSVYEVLHKDIVTAFQKTYSKYLTQTEHLLAVRFGLAKNSQETADALAKMIKDNGGKMQTGFVGTPYLLHVLSDYGHIELAYTMFLRTEYPSWLYSVEKGATTVWEHWDGIMEDGTFWDTNMNSFNHYAYGAVADWMYETVGGIKPIEDYPGCAKVLISPKPDKRLQWFEVSRDTKSGKIRSRWEYFGDEVRYEIDLEMPGIIKINQETREVVAGKYIFWS